jgi:precorrin-6A/cobalt-precorrin-6A reductase
VHVRVLLLGGTAEARALAAALTERGVDVISSLAGRVNNPVLPVGPTRVGGFGGPDGLATFVTDEHIAAIVDATHPFAAAITGNAASAARRVGLPLLVLRRPAWTQRPGDCWLRVADVAAAARAAAGAEPGTIFLTTGRRDLAAFAADTAHHYLVRAVDPPQGARPPRMTLVLDRGPYVLAAERDLMRTHDVRVLVTKDSGGELTVAKLDAARALELPVVMVDRPPLPDGLQVVGRVAEAVDWVAQLPAG